MKSGKRKLFEQRHSAELSLYKAATRYLENLKATGKLAKEQPDQSRKKEDHEL